MLFRQTDVRALALLLILLMPISRMYLGRHFLADVLGGTSQGLMALAIGWLVIIRSYSGRVTTWSGAGEKCMTTCTPRRSCGLA